MRRIREKSMGTFLFFFFFLIFDASVNKTPDFQFNLKRNRFSNLCYSEIISAPSWNRPCIRASAVPAPSPGVHVDNLLIFKKRSSPTLYAARGGRTSEVKSCSFNPDSTPSHMKVCQTFLIFYCFIFLSTSGAPAYKLLAIT